MQPVRAWRVRYARCGDPGILRHPTLVHQHVSNAFRHSVVPREGMLPQLFAFLYEYLCLSLCDFFLSIDNFIVRTMKQQFFVFLSLHFYVTFKNYSCS